MCKTPHKRTAKHKSKKIQADTYIKINTEKHAKNYPDIDATDTSYGVAGQYFHMDFKFVRGSSYSIKRKDQPTITSIDRYSSYLIIVDRITRYVWIFLTSSKAPPIHIAQKILTKLECKTSHRTARIDQGSKLGLSHEFKTC